MGYKFVFFVWIWLVESSCIPTYVLLDVSKVHLVRNPGNKQILQYRTLGSSKLAGLSSPCESFVPLGKSPMSYDGCSCMFEELHQSTKTIQSSCHYSEMTAKCGASCSVARLHLGTFDGRLCKYMKEVGLFDQIAIKISSEVCSAI